MIKRKRILIGVILVTIAVAIAWFFHTAGPDALRSAAEAGDSGKIELLVDVGVSPNAFNTYVDDCGCGESPGAGPALAYAIYACTGNPERLKTAALLLKRGADPNARDAAGMVPLMWVSSPAAVKLLLDHGADINATDNAGRRVLAVVAARYSDDAPVVVYLQAHGAM